MGKESTSRDEAFQHGAELAGLGILAVPYAARLGARAPGIRRVAAPVAAFYKNHHAFEDAAEIVGLGTLAAPSALHLGRRMLGREKKASAINAEVLRAFYDELAG